MEVIADMDARAPARFPIASARDVEKKRKLAKGDLAGLAVVDVRVLERSFATLTIQVSHRHWPFSHTLECQAGLWP